MAITMSIARARHHDADRVVSSAPPAIPTTRSVPSLEAALRDVPRLGGTVTSETRTAPGIGSWAFVADAEGVELVLWEDSPAIRP